MIRSRSWRYARAGAALAMATAAVAMGCGSGNDEASTNAAAEPAHETSTAAAATAGVKEATEIVAKFHERPQELEVTEPITKPIPEGKRITFLTCASPGCMAIADAVKDAASILNWSVKVLTVDATADAINKAYATAIRDKPDAIAVAAVSSEVARNKLAQLEKMGIPVVTAQDPDVPFGPIVASFYTEKSTTRLGQVHAANLVAHGCAEGTTIYIHVGGFKVLEHLLNSIEDEAERLSPGMKIEVVDIAATQEGNAQDAVVGKVRSTPDTTCIFASSDPLATGLPQALKNAGVRNLPQIFTDWTGDTTLQYIRDGLVTSSHMGDNGSFGFLFIDTLARHFAGQSVEPSANALATAWLVDRENAPDKVPYSSVPDLQEKYKRLWNK